MNREYDRKVYGDIKESVRNGTEAAPNNRQSSIVGLKSRERYYDSHYRDDEELSQSFFHQAAIENLMEVLKWQFFELRVGIATNINFYHDKLPNNEPLSPDIAIVDGLVIDERPADATRSYWIGEDGPPPRVVFEMSSEATWSLDLNEKKEKYALIGVREYIAFDPHQPGVWTKEWRSKNRLVGWRLDASGNYQEIAKREDGALWSEELSSWLVVDGKFLRLYTPFGEIRLNGFEAQRQAKEAERRAKELAQQEREAERRAKELAQQENEIVRQEREAERQEKELALEQLAELMEKLRKMGHDPDKL
jgi:Uma2 family endonuclease